MVLLRGELWTLRVFAHSDQFYEQNRLKAYKKAHSAYFPKEVSGMRYLSIFRAKRPFISLLYLIDNVPSVFHRRPGGDCTNGRSIFRPLVSPCFRFSGQVLFVPVPFLWLHGLITTNARHNVSVLLFYYIPFGMSTIQLCRRALKNASVLYIIVPLRKEGCLYGNISCANPDAQNII